MKEKRPKKHFEVAHSIGIAVTQCVLVFIFFLVAMYVPHKAILWPTAVICVTLIFYWSVNWYKMLLHEHKDSKVLPLALYMVFTYMLLVSLFGGLFVASEKLDGSIVDSHNPSRKIVAPFEHLYFSVVTGSTLGYGDLCPMGISRFFACLEVVLFWILVLAGTLKLGIE